MKKRESLFIRTAPYPALVLLLVLFFVPLASTLSQAFVVDGRLSFSRIAEVFRSPYNQRVILFTFKQAAVSTAVSLLIGLPGAYILARFTFPGKKIISSICTVPFVLPPILVVLGFVIFYGNSGFLNQLLMSVFHLEEPPLKILYSFGAIILAHSFYNFPVAMNLVSTSWQQLDENCEKAARNLGASRSRTFFSITLPRLLPSILSAAILIFLFCFTSFAVILVLGGGPQFTTIEVEIYNQAKRAMDIGQAASLSLMSLAVCVVLLILNSFLTRKTIRQDRVGSQNTRLSKASGFGLFLIVAYLFLLVLFVIAPIASVFVRSVLASGTRSGTKTISFELYRKLLEGQTLPAVLNSLTIGLVSCFCSLGTGLAICLWFRRHRGSVVQVLCMLPMAVSTVIIGLGYYIITRLFGHNLTFVLIVAAHVVITLPFVIRTILPVYRALPQNLINASLTLGASQTRTFFSVELPLLRPACLTAISFAFALSVGEMNATLMLSNNSIETIPVVIYRMINSYNYQGACALGSVLIVLCFLLFSICEKARKRSVYE